MGRIDIFKVDNKLICLQKVFFSMVFTKSRIGLENSISRLKKSKYFVYLVKTLSKPLCLREL